jgi:alkanesulfonate monooxygenase
MANPLKILWYINPHDGPYPWNPDGRLAYDPHRIRKTAIAADQAGYYGALTVGKSAFVEASSFITLTENLRFLIPVYPGQYQPALLVQMAQTFDEVSNGRLIFNQVNGTDLILPQYGVFVHSDDRYEMSAEYWSIFKKLYNAEIGGYEGKYFKFGPPQPAWGARGARVKPLVQSPHTPVWGSGASPAGRRHAGQVLDTYLTYIHRPDRLSAQIAEARAYAAQYGRTIGAGTLASIIVRESEEEAWDYAQQILEKTGAENIVRQINTRLNQGRYNVALGSRDGATFETLSSDDPKIQARIDKLRAGNLPDARELESYPNIWSGPSGSGIDILDQGWGGYLVGSAKNVAARIRELQADLGIDAFILAGWPLCDEAQRVADLLFPLLERDLSRPVMAPERTPPELASFATSAEQ